jgi:hypothetical protein
VARKRNYFDKDEIQCAKCLKVKNVSHFKTHPNTSSGYEYVCRFCGKLAERYGISDKQYRDMFERQFGICAICPETLELYARSTHIDHDHSCCTAKTRGCGKCVRGLLCQNCNLGLGNFRDNEDYLLKAVEYLRKNDVL